ncbi:hypothetical protein ACLB2K_012151 [Fragaria x ananassa]
MYKFYNLVEHENRPHDYMDSRPEINENMRAILMDLVAEWTLTMEKLDALRHANVLPSAVYAAECTLNKNPVLVSLHVKAVKNKLQGVSTRVLTSERGAVALLTPGKLDLATSQSFRRIFIDNQSWGSITKGLDCS